MNIREMKSETRRAYEFLKEYCKEHNIDDICELFDKKVLVEHVFQSDWDWSVQDEMIFNNLSEEEAVAATEQWFLSMSKKELFYDKICTLYQYDLIEDKAEDLGFDFEESLER